MPTVIKMAVKPDEPAALFGEGFFAVALFSAIGLVVTLVAVSCGMQGVWL